MKRRNFLARLAALVTLPAALRHVPIPESVGVVDVGDGFKLTTGPMVLTEPGHVYQYIQADRPLRAGEWVYWEDGVPMGVAVADIPVGHYGFVNRTPTVTF